MKWVLTRIAHSSIIVECEKDPLEKYWKYELDELFGYKLDNEYHQDGVTEWECDTVKNIYGENSNYEVVSD